LLSYLWHPYRPRLSLQASRELFGFSVWIFIDKIAAFGNARVADFFLGKLHGPTAVGTYRMGEEIGYLPGSDLVAPLNRALLPGAFRMMESGRNLSDIVLKANGVVMAILAPACLGICAVADPLVRVMLGSQWSDVIPILQVMALHALVLAMWANQHTILLAAGLPRLPGTIQIVRFILLLPLIFMLVPEYSGLGVAWAALTSTIIAAVAGFSLSFRRLNVPYQGFLAVIWRPLVAGAAMFFVVRWVVTTADGYTGVSHAMLALLAGVGVGVVVFCAALFLLYHLAGRPEGAERLIFERLAAIRKSRTA
jgi:O-antigen/teichoic acid export membrane protein